MRIEGGRKEEEGEEEGMNGKECGKGGGQITAACRGLTPCATQLPPQPRVTSKS